MLKNKYAAAVIAVLFVIVIAYNLNFFYTKGRSSVKPTVKSETLVKHSSADVAKSHERLTEQQDKGLWKRDPFDLQSAAVKTGAGEIQLTGILKRDGKSHALINNRVYAAHDKIGDSVIKEIKRFSIVLSTHGEINEIYLDDYKVVKEKKK